MRADGPNFELSALCEMTGLGVLGLIQALEQYLVAQGVTGGYRTCPECVITAPWISQTC